jgi:hypothetical protein
MKRRESVTKWIHSHRQLHRISGCQIGEYLHNSKEEQQQDETVSPGYKCYWWIIVDTKCIDPIRNRQQSSSRPGRWHDLKIEHSFD